jgi:DNA-binding SARP family transcriptional activator
MPAAPTAAGGPSAVNPVHSTGTDRPDRNGQQEHTDNPLPVQLEIGLAALAALALLDRARRIAQRRRRRGHRLSPPPPPLASVEARLRRDARTAHPTVAAVQLATALTATSPLPVRAVIARDDGSVDLWFHHPVDEPAPPPFVTVDGAWRLPADATGFGFAVDDIDERYPALTPIGRVRDGSVLVDFAATGPIGIVGDPAAVESHLAGLVTALAGAPWATRLSLHVPPTVAARVPSLDNLVVEDAIAAGLDLPHSATAALTDVDTRQGWSTTPLHLYCGWSADDDVDRLLELAADPTTNILVILNGLHAAAAPWTLDGDLLSLPDLAEPVTTQARDGATDDVVELLNHVATAGDVPVGDPRLPNLTADAPSTAARTTLQLNVLGPVELTGTERPRRSQTLNLLAYLALHRGGADHDQIATALWPEQVVSGKTLRNRITEARALVGGAISEGPRWRLDETVSTDWQRFTALADGTLAEQHAALALARGRPFHGLDDTEWIDLEGFRTEVEAAIVDLAITVAEHDLAVGDYAAAFTAARAGLAASRYEERLHRLAIRAAQGEGSTGKVRSLKHEMRTVLDVDIEPGDRMQPDTIALYEEMTGLRRVGSDTSGH